MVGTVENAVWSYRRIIQHLKEHSSKFNDYKHAAAAAPLCLLKAP